MIKKLLISVLPIAAMVILTSGIMSDNGKAGRTGSPGESNCTNCHNSFANNSGGGSISIQSPGMTGNTYTPGQMYSMSVTVTKTGVGLFGIGIEALTSSNANGGTLTISDAASSGIKNATVSGVSRINIVHKLNGGIGTNTKVFNFNWTAPTAGTGNVTFYFSGIAANGNGNENGDYVYTSSQVYTESGSSSCTTAPPQPGSITGNATTCSGSSVTYSVAAVSGATSYNWTLPSGWTGTSTTNNITAIAGANSGTISVIAGNGCGNSQATTLPVTITILTATITANGNTLQASAGTSYEWYLNGNFITGAINSTYTPTQSGNYTVVVYSNGCHASSAPYPFTVTSCTSAPLQPGSITGNTTTCSGTSVTYSVAAVSGAASYTWTLPSGWTGTSTANSITATAGNTGGNISVMAVNGCGNSPATTLPVTITTQATPTISVIGSTLQASAGTSYEWYLNGNIIPGANGSSYTPVQDGSYVVVVYDNGCHASSAPYIVSSACTSAPAYPGNIIGNTSACSGTSVIFSVTPVSGATSYNWILPSGWTGNSTSNNIIVTTGSSSGTISVSAGNGCGNSPASYLSVNLTTVFASITYINHTLYASQGTFYEWYLNGILIQGATNSSYIPNQDGSYTVMIYENGCHSLSSPFIVSSSCSSAPGQPGTIAGNSSACNGSTLTYSIQPVAGATTYTWTLPTGWTGSSTSNSISVIAGTIPGMISVTAGNACGSSQASSLNVSITTVYATISFDGIFLQASAGTSYEWYIDGNIIPGANSSYYAPTSVGNFSVRVFDNGCYSTSAPYYVSYNGINDLADGEYHLTMFPNPAADYLTIHTPDEMKTATLFIYDFSGRVVRQLILQGGENVINISELAEGVYTAVTDTEKKLMGRILITK